MNERRRRRYQFGIPAIGVAAGRSKARTEVLFPDLAPATDAAREMNPRNADPIALVDVRRPTFGGDYSPDNLMARDHGIARSDDPSFEDVEIGSAKATDRHTHQDLAVPGCRVGHIRGFERRGVRRDWVRPTQEERAQLTASVLDYPVAFEMLHRLCPWGRSESRTAEEPSASAPAVCARLPLLLPFPLAALICGHCRCHCCRIDQT